MSIELKIKSKHLSLEPALIEKEIKKLKAQYKYLKENEKSTSEVFFKMQKLIEHKRWNLRNEARATHLARAFINDTPYKVVEQKIHNNLYEYLIPKIVKMVSTYHNPQIRKEDINKWIFKS